MRLIIISKILLLIIKFSLDALQITYRTDDEAGYNTTQHILQQTSSNYETHENGGGNYAKLQNDEVVIIWLALLRILI